MENLKIIWSSSVKFLKGYNKTLVANVDNAKSLFVSNECFEIIEEASKKGLTLEQVLKNIEDLESKNYFKQLIHKLHELEMWKCNEKSVQGKDISISLDITNKCNLKCKHCCVDAGDNKRGMDIPTSDLKKIIDYVAEIDPQLIIISGGEPLARSDFEEITRYIRSKYSGLLFLMTNATLVNDTMAKFIAQYYDHVDVSIDGVNEETCSLIRGKGVFEKTLDGIKKMKAEACKITASMVVTNDNEEFKPQFADLCKNILHIKYMYRIFEPVGRGLRNKEIFEPKKNEDDIKMNWQYCKKKFLENKMHMQMPQVFACQGAKREFQIDHTGNLYPCAALMDEEFQMGNVLNVTSLKEYLLKGEYKKTKGYKKFQTYMPYNIEGCCECNKQLLCFSCVNEVKRNIKTGIFRKNCKANNKFYDMYWRYYGID